MNKIYCILILLCACVIPRNSIKTGNEKMVNYIKQQKFDSLVTIWINKPFNFDDTAQIRQIIRIGNHLEVILLWVGAYDTTNNVVIYDKFMNKYYNEFHKIAYYHKDFISINDSVNTFCKRYGELSMRAKILQKRRFKKTALKYIPANMTLFAGTCQFNDIYYICKKEEFCDD
jgi:hypothetical protein